MTQAQSVVEALKAHGLKISFAESCTGGLVSSLITDVSGASEVFECAVVSYSNRIKHKILGVDSETLEKYSAVSEQTVIEMAKGVKQLSGSDISVAVSGIAGPNSDSSQAEVGLIWICVDACGKVITKKLNNSFSSDVRRKNREAAALAAFDMVLSALQ